MNKNEYEINVNITDGDKLPGAQNTEPESCFQKQVTDLNEQLNEHLKDNQVVSPCSSDYRRSVLEYQSDVNESKDIESMSKTFYTPLEAKHSLKVPYNKV